MRVALLADFLEEGWPSMDLVADMLALHLSAGESPEVEIHHVRPAFRQRFSRKCAGARWSADRLTNRFFDYPRFLRKQRSRFDLFHLVDHSYSQLLHELPSTRSIVTCHDLDTFRCLWEPAGGGRGRLFRAMTQRILSGMQKAAHVCCVSQATRDELLGRGLLPVSRLSVVRSGLRPDFLAPADPAASSRVDELLGRPGLGPLPTVDLLHVGSTIARKRIDVLLEVFARVRQEIEPRARLLRVGGAFTAAQSRQMASLGLPVDSICVLPFLTPAELAAVYRRAALVLLPSEAEGFGFPVIEALACGTPVLASDLNVLREAGGEATDYAPAGHISAWLTRISELLIERDNHPAHWELRRERGRLQAARFSWAETARQTVAIYTRVLEQGS